jgi:transcriptional regulator with XRE-family HTH domain
LIDGEGLTMSTQKTSQQAEKMTEELAARLNEAILDSGLRQSDIAGKIGCDASYITRWKNNKYRPSKIYLGKIAEVTSVNLDWLLTGEGEKKAVATTPALPENQISERTAAVEKQVAAILKFGTDRQIEEVLGKIGRIYNQLEQ